MKLKASVNNNLQDLIVDEVDGTLQVQINDRRYEFQIHNAGENSYLLLNDGRVFDCRVQLQPGSRDQFVVSVKGQRHAITIIDPRRLRVDGNSDRHHHGATEITAQMPGKVVRVLVEAGTKVEKGAGIIVVEAMKMQNEMKSPRTGVVASISVLPGDTVNAGEVLATVGDVE